MNALSNNIQIYLGLSAIFFVFGALAALTRKNAVGLFMGVELMLNAAALNFVAFQSFQKTHADSWLHGQIFALFVIILAAIEAAVALGIVLRLFGTKHNINPDKATELKG